MQTKLRLKIIKYHKNLFYIVIALNKKSIRSRYIDKIGVGFLKQKKKIIMLSLKKLSFWINKGVKLNKYVSYIFSILFQYYLKNIKLKNNVTILQNLTQKKIKKIKSNFKSSNKFIKD